MNPFCITSICDFNFLIMVVTHLNSSTCTRLIRLISLHFVFAIPNKPQYLEIPTIKQLRSISQFEVIQIASLLEMEKLIRLISYLWKWSYSRLSSGPWTKKIKPCFLVDLQVGDVNTDILIRSLLQFFVNHGQGPRISNLHNLINPIKLTYPFIHKESNEKFSKIINFHAYM